jgi:hypothetical protein
MDDVGSILWPFGLILGYLVYFCGQLVSFTVNWYIFLFWYIVPRENLATLR